MPAANASNRLPKRWVRREEAKHLGRGQLATESWLETPHTKKPLPRAPGQAPARCRPERRPFWLVNTWTPLIPPLSPPHLPRDSVSSVQPFLGHRESGQADHEWLFPPLFILSPFLVHVTSYEWEDARLYTVAPLRSPSWQHRGEQTPSEWTRPRAFASERFTLSIHQHVLRRNRLKKRRVREKPARTSPEMTKGSKEA